MITYLKIMKYIYYAILLLYFMLSKVHAIDISSKEFDSTKITFPNYSNGEMTLPVMLVYDVNGKLIHSVFGQDIYKIESYQDLSNKESKRLVSTPNINEILGNLKIEKKRNGKAMIYLGLEICAPCFTLLEKFNDQAKADLEKEYEIFLINILVH